jgi:hypothetical protein
MTDDDLDLSERGEYVRQLVLGRCPEVSADEIAEAFAALPDPDAIPGPIGALILEVLDRLADRMDALETAGRPN